MEKTMFQVFSMGQRLRTLFHIDRIPSSLHPLVSLCRTVFKSDIRGAALADALAFDETFQKQEEKVTWGPRDLSPLSPAAYQLLRNWIRHKDPDMRNEPIVSNAFSRTSIGRLGQLFQTSNISASNSQVVFTTTSGEWSAGTISEIFTHTRRRQSGQVITETFVLVQELASLSASQVHLDNYRKFPVVGGRLFHNRTNYSPTLLNMNEIDCHFVSCQEKIPGISRSCILALPLDQVSDSYSLACCMLRLSGIQQS
jgi:hypothetical protein